MPCGAAVSRRASRIEGELVELSLCQEWDRLAPARKPWGLAGVRFPLACQWRLLINNAIFLAGFRLRCPYNINVSRDSLCFWTQPACRSLAITNDFYPAILRATRVRGVARDWASVSVSFGTEAAAVDAVFGQPIHDRIGSIGR